MKTKRTVSWVAFFGVAAVLAWGPEYFKQADEGEASVAVVATPGNSKTVAAQPAAAAGKTPLSSRTSVRPAICSPPAAGRRRRCWPASLNNPST